MENHREAAPRFACVPHRRPRESRERPGINGDKRPYAVDGCSVPSYFLIFSGKNQEVRAPCTQVAGKGRRSESSFEKAVPGLGKARKRGGKMTFGRKKPAAREKIYPQFPQTHHPRIVESKTPTGRGTGVFYAGVFHGIPRKYPHFFGRS